MAEIKVNEKVESEINDKDVFFVKEFLNGIFDSLKVFATFAIILESSKISSCLKNCMIFNGLLFIGSMIFYSYLINPIAEYIIYKFNFLGYFALMGKYLYYFFWLMPIFLVCQIITSFWIDEIYYESLKIIEKQNYVVEGQDFITNLSNQLERILFVISFMLFISIINFFSYIPGVTILKYLVICILNSVYVFEYILLQKYIRNYKSIMYFIESKIFYFLGYGILLTIIINLINSATINSSIFLMAFPFFLISSIQLNELRFKKSQEINSRKLRFFFFINKFYEGGLWIIHCTFKLRNK